jgi:hypothetical protein
MAATIYEQGPIIPTGAPQPDRRVYRFTQQDYNQKDTGTRQRILGIVR